MVRERNCCLGDFADVLDFASSAPLAARSCDGSNSRLNAGPVRSSTAKEGNSMKAICLLIVGLAIAAVANGQGFLRI